MRLSSTSLEPELEPLDGLLQSKPVIAKTLPLIFVLVEFRPYGLLAATALSHLTRPELALSVGPICIQRVGSIKRLSRANRTQGTMNERPVGVQVGRRLDIAMEQCKPFSGPRVVSGKLKLVAQMSLELAYLRCWNVSALLSPVW